MIQEVHSLLQPLLGLDVDPQKLTFAQMGARALVVFASTLVMLRLAHKRFFARRNTLDLVLAVIIASILSRAVNGSASFFPTIGVGYGFIFLHRLLAWIASRSAPIERLVKGTSSSLIDQGEVDIATLRRHSLSLDDLKEDLRLAGIERPESVRTATLERNGEVSVVKN